MSTTDSSDSVAEDPYDSTYAKTYADRWWDADHWQADRRWYEGLIRERLAPSTRWLDVGCGTGYFLSEFPTTERAGLDFSGEMLKVARESNPGVTFKRADATKPQPDWDGAWDLVTCTGEPWSYLTSLDQFERWVANMAAWTSPHGVCLIQTPDAADLASATIPYRFTEEEPPPGTWTILGVMWDMTEGDVEHGQMIWPSIDLWARWFGRHFTRVEVLHPDPDAGVIYGRTVLASGKREPGDDRPTIYVYEPPSVPAVDATPPVQNLEVIEALRHEIDQIRTQLADVVDLLARPTGEVDPGSERYDIVAMIHDQVGGIRRELAELSERSAIGTKPGVLSRATHKARKLLRR